MGMESKRYKVAMKWSNTYRDMEVHKRRETDGERERERERSKEAETR
jgi:hypothetical protein